MSPWSNNTLPRLSAIISPAYILPTKFLGLVGYLPATSPSCYSPTLLVNNYRHTKSDKRTLSSQRPSCPAPTPEAFQKSLLTSDFHTPPWKSQNSQPPSRWLSRYPALSLGPWLSWGWHTSCTLSSIILWEMLKRFGSWLRIGWGKPFILLHRLSSRCALHHLYVLGHMCTIRVRIGYKEAGVYCRVGNGDSGTSNGININLKVNCAPQKPGC